MINFVCYLLTSQVFGVSWTFSNVNYSLVSTDSQKISHLKYSNTEKCWKKLFECLSCLGLKGDENENEDSIVLDEDDEEIPNELDEIEDGATVEDEAEDPGTRRCFRRVSFTSAICKNICSSVNMKL